MKNIHKNFKEYCACREQIIEFKGRYYDLFEIHCKYYEEVLEYIFLFYYNLINIIFFLQHHNNSFIERKIFQNVMNRLYDANQVHPYFGY